MMMCEIKKATHTYRRERLSSMLFSMLPRTHLLEPLLSINSCSSFYVFLIQYSIIFYSFAKLFPGFDKILVRM